MAHRQPRLRRAVNWKKGPDGIMQIDFEPLPPGLHERVMKNIGRIHDEISKKGGSWEDVTKRANEEFGTNMNNVDTTIYVRRAKEGK